MPHCVKIGFTKKCVNARIKALSQTSVPIPFECVFAFRCNHGKAIEEVLHTALGEYRVGGEFFRVSIETAVSVMKTAMLLVNGRETTAQSNCQESIVVARVHSLPTTRAPQTPEETRQEHVQTTRHGTLVFANETTPQDIPARAGQKWLEEEIRMLKDLFLQDESIDSISTVLERSKTGCAIKLKQEQEKSEFMTPDQVEKVDSWLQRR